MAGPVPVPFLDLQALHLELADELDAAARRVLRGDRLLLGPELAGFEAAWAAQVGSTHAVGVGSGLDALALGLRALGVRPGDEVLVPAHTYIATWLAVTHVGAVPVPVDAAAGATDVLGAWDADAAAVAVTARTRAVLPVHLYGHPVDLDPVLALAREHGLAVLDDAAQAHGARHRGQPVGGLTGATAWSFYPGKNLGALGDGGAVTTSDDEVAESVRRLRNYGSTTKYVHEEIGWNSRLDELQAAFLTVKLQHLATHNARRAAVAARYTEALSDLDLVLPRTAPWAVPAWHLYVVRTPRRQAVQERLAALGIETGVHYPVPPHRQQAYADSPLAAASFPVAEQLAGEVLSLPIGPTLAVEQQEAVIAALRACAG